MKTKIGILLTLIASASVAFGATMTIDVPDAQVPRVLEAYGSIYNLGRNATPAEVQVMIQGWLQNSTMDYERRKNMAQFTPSPVYSPTPTTTPGGLAAPAGIQGQQTPPSPTATPKTKKK